jgi:hypothetical protein
MILEYSEETHFHVVTIPKNSMNIMILHDNYLNFLAVKNTSSIKINYYRNLFLKPYNSNHNFGKIFTT